MFDFATMSQNGILCWNIQFTFCAYCPLVPYVEGIFFKQEKTGNTDGINCSFKKGRTETF